MIEAMQNQGNIARLKTEIEQLEQKLQEERDFPTYIPETIVPLVLSVNHR